MSAERSSPSARRVARGLSIVELMVGIVIALLVGLAAASSAVMFGALQRQGIGTGGALVNANSALAALKDDVAAAGLGFFGDSRYLCTRLNLSLANKVHVDGASFVPLRITRTDNRDRIDVVYADQIASGTNVLTDGTSTGVSAAVRSLMPINVGQAVLVAPATPGDPCVVRTVSESVAATDDNPQTLSFGDTGAHNKAAFTTNPNYADQSRITLLGTLRWANWQLEGTDLILTRPLEGGASAVLARNVVAFRVQYGVAAVGSTALSEWVDATGDFASLDANTLPRVRALRIGVVTRSPQPEKRNAAGDCEATAALPELMGSTVTADVTDWQCYRFRTALTVVPLQNFVMGVAP
jgi:type IV pilus assembly protein PilW